MSRIILACGLAGILAVPAKADETLKFRVVQYGASVQFQPIGDVSGHIQAFLRYRGSPVFLMGA